MLLKDNGATFDPRSLLPRDELQRASIRAAPYVAREPRRGDSIGLAAGVIGALALGAFTLVWLSHQRASEPAPAVSAPTAPAVVGSEPAVGVVELPPAPAPEMQMDVATASTATAALPMVIDNSAATVSVQMQPGESAGAEAGAAFAVSTGADAAAARAEPPPNPSATVAQGTIIPAVLETAINSEAPGFARAIVSRDVRSFDGAAVLIPRGSRVIGQYRASSTPGQSRAYIVWSRLIRPDGVSIQLASPALDMSGASGIPGTVDRHFFQNFGGSFLMSVIGALPAVANAGSPTVVIGTNAAAQTSQAMQSDRVPPTIRVPIGTPIQVFTARDLSF